MARYKNLTKTKREFLEELIELDEEYNFLSGIFYETAEDILKEKRYLTADSEWLNKHLNVYKEYYIKYKKLKDNS